MWDRLFEVFREMPRGGPGTPEAMAQALDLMTGLPASPRVLDLGCGPGSGSSRLSDVSHAGFAIVGHFTLPRAAWWDHYYVPMRSRVEGLRAAWEGDEIGRGVITSLEREIAIFEGFGHTYSHEFIVGRRT
jgi:hypothetical protein